MQELLYCDMPELLEKLKIIKEFHDEGSDQVVTVFSEFGINADEFEMCAYEEMWSLPGYRDSHELYYEDEHGEIPEDSEAYGEVWTFATEEMIAYYRFLKELKASGKISRRTYLMKVNEMEKYVKRYVADSQDTYYSGLFCELVYGRAPKNLYCIKVYLDYDYCFSSFVLCCGIAAIFDKYAEKLKELQEQFCSEEPMLEAA